MAGLIDVGILKPELGNALAAGYNQAEERRNLLAQQQQQRQLGEIQLQNALREQRMAGEEEAAYKTAGSDYAKLQAELMQRGLGKQAMAIGAQQAKMQADKIAMLKGTTELMKSAASSVMENPTLENALAAVKDLGQRTGTDVSRDVDALTKTGGNPEAIYKWAAGHAVSADKRLNEFKQFSVPGVGVQTGTTDFTGNFKPGQVFREQMSQAQMAQDARDRQRLGLERQRVGLEGERVQIARDEAKRKELGLEALPPKEIQKREAAYPQATSSIKGFETKSDDFIKDLEKLRDDPGLNLITGSVYGRTPSLSREGSRAQATYNKIFAKGGFQALQDMRDASKTGGALGNVSNQEGERLERSVVGGLDRTQNVEDVKKGIDDLIDQIKGSKVRMREAYDMTYDYKRAKPAAGGGWKDL